MPGFFQREVFTDSFFPHVWVIFSYFFACLKILHRTQDISVFTSSETDISGNFWGRNKGAKYRFTHAGVWER